MSGSSCNTPPQDIIPVEEEQLEEGCNIELKNVEIAASSSSQKQKEKESNSTLGDDHHQNKLEHQAKGSTIGSSSSSSSRELPQKTKVSEGGNDDDVEEGFKTPTSSDHKIPAITQCPPAPIKPRPARLSMKRKASPPASSGAHRSLQFDDSSTEVESIFRPLGDKKDNVEEPQDDSCKRAKNADDDNED